MSLSKQKAAGLVTAGASAQLKSGGCLKVFIQFGGAGGGRCQIHSSGAGINHFVSLYGVVRSGCRCFGLKKDITAHRKPRGTHRHTTYSTEEVSLEAILVLISLTGAAHL